MRILIATLSIFSLLFLFSCQKEGDFSNGNGSGGGNNTGGTLLKKLVSKSGSDSSVLAFGYNSSKKIISLDITVTSGGISSLTQERAERNTQGIIQKIIIKNAQYQQLGIDSVVTVMHYASAKYTSKVTAIDLGIIVFRDSVALIYDAAGKVGTEKTYTDFGTGYEEFAKSDYTYTGNNIASIKAYSYDAISSSYRLDETYTYDQYDNKISPIFADYDAFAFDSPFFYSSNNPVKSTYSAPGYSTENYTISYTYNSANRPITASSTMQPGNVTSTGTYYYQ